jgi:hypothetical protein
MNAWRGMCGTCCVLQIACWTISLEATYCCSAAHVNSTYFIMCSLHHFVHCAMRTIPQSFDIFICDMRRTC